MRRPKSMLCPISMWHSKKPAASKRHPVRKKQYMLPWKSENYSASKFSASMKHSVHPSSKTRWLLCSSFMRWYLGGYIHVNKYIIMVEKSSKNVWNRGCQPARWIFATLIGWWCWTDFIDVWLSVHHWYAHGRSEFHWWHHPSWRCRKMWIDDCSFDGPLMASFQQRCPLFGIQWLFSRPAIYKCLAHNSEGVTLRAHATFAGGHSIHACLDMRWEFPAQMNTGSSVRWV